VTELQEPEKEAVSKIQGFIENDVGSWVLRREDLQNAGADGYGEDSIKRVLHEVEAVISQAPDYEIGVVFDKDGRFIVAWRGGEDSVDASDMDLVNKIFTHNHPGGMVYLGFSLGDILGACEADVLELRAVVEGGSFVSLRKGMNGTGSGLAEASVDMAGNIGYAGRRALQVPVGAGWLQANAGNFGYSFVREVKSAQSGRH